MRILGIETSCDETSAAVIEAKPGDQKVTLISNVISSSLPIHAKTGGIIPENAAREQIKFIIPVIKQALKTSRFPLRNPASRLSFPTSELDAIAVTIGPGLIGSLLIGVETAKTLAFTWNKPIIPVNHLIGHIYANFIHDSQLSTLNSQLSIKFPAIVLIVSGGHTDLLLMKNHRDLKWLGGTRDDAAGEAFDKIGRLLNLPYPGGPAIEKAAKEGNPKAFNLPRPMIGSNDFDFSFSGLKTSVLRQIKTIEQLNNRAIADLSASVQQSIIDVLVKKTINAALHYKVKSILLSGGVSANQKLRDQFSLEIGNWKFDIGLFAPPAQFCTDNAAMIAAAAFFNYKPVTFSQITANPELYFNKQ